MYLKLAIYKHFQTKLAIQLVRTVCPYMFITTKHRHSVCYTHYYQCGKEMKH